MTHSDWLRAKMSTNALICRERNSSLLTGWYYCYSMLSERQRACMVPVIINMYFYYALPIQSPFWLAAIDNTFPCNYDVTLADNSFLHVDMTSHCKISPNILTQKLEKIMNPQWLQSWTNSLNCFGQSFKFKELGNLCVQSVAPLTLLVSIFAQVNIINPTTWLVKFDVLSCYIHLQVNITLLAVLWKFTDKEISEIKINSVPNNTKDLCKNTKTIIRLRLGDYRANIHLDFVSANIPR
jgi:hypothetical protein